MNTVKNKKIVKYARKKAVVSPVAIPQADISPLDVSSVAISPANVSPVSVFPTADSSSAVSTKELSLGRMIKRARLGRLETLGSISKVLHIKEHYLRAIEDDRIEDLPKEMSYSIGFLKAYAQFLALDPSEIVAAFKKQHAESFAPANPFLSTVLRLTPSMEDSHEEHAEQEENEGVIAVQQEKEATYFLMGWVSVAAVSIILLVGRDTIPLPESLKSVLDSVANLF
jgi:hypothetical protein